MSGTVTATQRRAAKETAPAVEKPGAVEIGGSSDATDQT
jgi:hypothetical protein